MVPTEHTTGQTPPWRSSNGSGKARLPEPLAHTRRLTNLQHVVSRVNEGKSVGRQQKRGGGGGAKRWTDKRRCVRRRRKRRRRGRGGSKNC